MQWKKHSDDLVGKHAILSPSKYHWINYDNEKFNRYYSKYMATLRGTEMHEFACNAIKLGIKLSGDDTVCAYVNDAIDYGMTPEQILYYSDNCFGTADAISFRKNILRIHDLKTGSTVASIHQLEVYAAIFCLEYNAKPEDILINLRIYQSKQVQEAEPSPEDIRYIMNKIVDFDKKLNFIKT